MIRRTGQVSVELLGGCVWTAVAFVALSVGFGGCYGCSHVKVADGYRDSTVRKMSETGLFFPTWEVEGLGDGIGRMQPDKTFGPEVFKYTVPATNVEVIEKLKAIPPDRRVRIHYRKMMTAWSPKGESKYFITRVEELSGPSK